MGSEVEGVLWIWNWLPWGGITHFICRRKKWQGTWKERGFQVSIHRQGKCPASVSTLGASDLPTDIHCEALGRTGGGWGPFLGDIHRVPFEKRHLWDPQFITTSETGTCGSSFSSFLRELDGIIWSLSPLGISTPSVCLLALSFLFVFFPIFKHAWVVDALWEHHRIQVWVPTLPDSDPRGLRESILSHPCPSQPKSLH